MSLRSRRVRSRLAGVEVGLEHLGDPMAALFQVGPAGVVDRRCCRSRARGRSGRRSPSSAAAPAPGRRPADRRFRPAGIRRSRKDRRTSPALLPSTMLLSRVRYSRSRFRLMVDSEALARLVRRRLGQAIEVRPDAVGQRPEHFFHLAAGSSPGQTEAAGSRAGKAWPGSGSGPARSSGWRGSARSTEMSTPDP